MGKVLLTWLWCSMPMLRVLNRMASNTDLWKKLCSTSRNIRIRILRQHPLITSESQERHFLRHASQLENNFGTIMNFQITMAWLIALQNMPAHTCRSHMVITFLIDACKEVKAGVFLETRLSRLSHTFILLINSNNNIPQRKLSLLCVGFYSPNFLSYIRPAFKQ